MAGINWRSQTDIDEENRYGVKPNPDRCVAVMTLHCEGCGCEITEVHFEDGRRSFVEHGVRSVLGDGVYCRTCPDRRQEDLKHDADTERNDAA